MSYEEAQRMSTLAGVEQIGWDPERLDTIWGRRAASSRGPKQSLTVDQVLAAAIDLADAEGLEAVSMKRIADRLGVGVMTIYTYVPDKSTLLEMMLDTVLGQMSLPGSDRPWREYLTEATELILACYQQHPWAVQIVPGGPPITPNQMRYVETALAVLEPTGLSDRQMIDVTMVTSYYVRGVAQLALGIMRSEASSGRSAEETGRIQQAALRRVLDPVEFSRTLRVLTGPPDDPPLEDEWDDFGFRFGLERLLDGIEALIAGRAGPSRG